jgi:hypothetical protein
VGIDGRPENRLVFLKRLKEGVESAIPERADARAFATDARTDRAAARRTDAGFAKDAGPSSRAASAAAKDGENVTPPTTETRSTRSAV